MTMPSSWLPDIRALRDTGYCVLPGFIPRARLAELNKVARFQLQKAVAPLEYEADLHYPGAPASHTAAGGKTVRRLLDAYPRDPLFAECARDLRVGECMESYFGETVLLSCVHHNCLMTKHPRYGSMTGWHRDIRFWSFEREDLVSMWLALGEETPENGGLWFVPGSHTANFEAERFDAQRFFRVDDAANAALLRTAESPRLAPGDAVFFHCNTLHSAGRNTTDAVKFSLVFTYHAKSNRATAGSRSASKPEIDIISHSK